MNPYEPPGVTEEQAGVAEPEPAKMTPIVPTTNAGVPRYIAAVIDNLISFVAGIVAAKAIAQDYPMTAYGVFAIVCLGYYLLFEGMIGRTPGKLATGLVVLRYDGERCTWTQALIRTVFRVIEVNPLLLGALPAAVFITFTRHNQRLGDRVARTVVSTSK